MDTESTSNLLLNQVLSSKFPIKDGLSETLKTP